MINASFDCEVKILTILLHIVIGVVVSTSGRHLKKKRAQKKAQTILMEEEIKITRECAWWEQRFV